MWDDLELLDAEREHWDAPAERVLVAVVPRPSDWARVRDEGWYRIPYARAPRRLAADYLAFYHPGCFDASLRWTVRYYAAVRRYSLLTRAELLPDEADHPRADDLYYRLELGSLEELAAPIPSARLRRVTFIATTLPLLLAAGEINDLWPRETRPQRLRRAYALRERARTCFCEDAPAGLTAVRRRQPTLAV